ncbi:MAG: hypothetical protein CMH54_07200 [Myxococcales bacterium]|nr:hypothetical protein [Myxococcales bacterium]
MPDTHPSDVSVHPARLIWTFLRRYGKPYRLYYALGFVALFATNAIAILIPRQFEAAVDILHGAAPGVTVSVTEPVLNILVLALALVVIRTLSRVLFFNPGRAIERDLRNDIFRWYLGQKMEWYQGRNTGDLITRATHDVLAVRALVGYAFLQAANMVILLSLVLSQMVSISPVVTAYAVLPLAIGMIVLRLAISRLLVLSREALTQLGLMEQQVLEGLKGVRIVRDFGASSLVHDRFETINNELLTIRLKITRIAAFLLPIIRVAGHIAIGILLCWGAFLVRSEELPAGEIAAYIAYLSMLIGVLFSAGWMLNALQRGLVSLRRIVAVMPLDVPLEHPNQASDPVDEELPGSVRIDGLCLQRDEHSILKDISFHLKEGQHLGILGTVGSGKTSLANILSGLLAPTSGTVEIGGGRLDSAHPERIWKRVRLVPDVPFLFTRTLAENVGFSSPPEDLDREKIRRSLYIAGFDVNAEGLSEGLDTLVGEKGIALSGGQKQRITLARALYDPGEILILDDVLSAVDHRAEQNILTRLHEWRSSTPCTLINISNRVSALQDADHVLVLHQGRIEESGTPAELLKNDGLYARTYRLQAALQKSQDEEGTS